TAPALPNKKKGEQIILITSSKSATKESVREGIKAEGHSDLLAPKTIILVDEVPVLGTGKTDYVGAQRLAEENFTG
ncbi:MAG: hypothetical protein P8I94_07025, partial [Emcibacteraceae bacterium]|nr:hypothetical protein [Emcibacteraceae bacterium]